MSLVQDKVLALAVTASLALHMAVLYGVPGSRLSRRTPPEETYIEFMYYQVHADEEPQTSMEGEECTEPAAIEEAPRGMKEPVVMRAENEDASEESLTKEPDRKIQVKVREKALRPPPGGEGIFEEGRLINEYARTLDGIIERNRPSYPASQRQRFMEGSVLLHLRVSRDGSLKSVTVLRDACSGPADFKRAAIEAVRRASVGFPPFPDDLKREEILFTLPVSFVLEY